MSKDRANIHDKAVRDFGRIQAAMQDERQQCLEDRRFYSISGAQWEGDLGDQFENRPKFEVNKIHLSVIRIINEYLTNRITVDYVSKDGDKDDLSGVCDGLYRADEQDSNSNEAYDNAFEEAVGGGFGAYRFTALEENEEDEEDERQRISIEPIYDADSCVFFDLAAKRQDKRDAKYCFVISSMTRQDFEEEYPEASPVSVSKVVDDSVFDWGTDDVVFIAEYYVVEMQKETIHIYKDLSGSELRYTEKELEKELETLQATNASFVRSKKVNRKKIRKYILNGMEILEDCGYIAGKHIPIVPVYGKRWYIDNVERCMGHVRLSKGAQRLKNMQLSKLAEISALSSVEKPIFTPEQIAGHQNMWSEDNIKNYPYMLINPMTDSDGNEVPAGVLGYTKPPQIPPAMAALLQVTEQDMQDMLGKQEAGEELNSNVSGNAIELVQNRLDMQSYIYMDNMAKAIKRGGEIWLSMAKELYVESGRKMKTVDHQGKTSPVILAQLDQDEETGDIVYRNDLTKANFNVSVNVGPSSTSRKQATIRSLMAMMQITTDPQTMQVLGGMAMMNMEGEGIEDVRDYFREKMLNLGVVKPTKEEAQQMQEAMQNKKPDANEELLKSAAAKEQALAQKASADTQLSTEKAAETRAKTAEIYAGIDQADRNFGLELSKATAQPN